MKKISDGEYVITEGALYPMLHKLEADGLLTVEKEYIGKRVRKYYSITEHGQTEMVNKMDDLEQFVRNMQLLLNPNIKLV